MAIKANIVIDQGSTFQTSINVTDQNDDEIIDGEKRRVLFAKYRDYLEILLKDESVETVSISISTMDLLTIKIISNQQHNWTLNP